jgi:ABC-2 type transport system permease protein
MMLQPRLVWELARKDLQLFLADRRGAVLCFAVPILLASAFGALFPRPLLDRLRVPLFLVAEDDSPLTQRVVAALEASDKVEVHPTDRAGALEQIEQQGSGVVLILPAGFGRVTDLSADRPQIELHYHPGSHLESQWVEGIFTQIVLREAATQLLAPLTRANPSLHIDRPFAVERSSITAVGPLGENVYCHSFCGMTLQYLLFWGMDSGLLLLRERRQGIWRRLQAAPVTHSTLLAGKVLATAIVALAQMAITFSFGHFVFGVSVSGSVLGFAGVALAAALLSAGTGLLVAALGGNEGRARSMAILTILALSMLGGLWLPSFLLPSWVQQLAVALPTTWAVRGLEGVTWQGMAAGPALRCAAILLGFSAAFLIVALWSFARSEARARCGRDTI